MSEPTPWRLVLGIDPGTHKCGGALVYVPLQGEVVPLRTFVLHGGQGDYIQRIRRITDSLDEILEEHAEVAPGAGWWSKWESGGTMGLLAIEEPYSGTGSGSQGRDGLQYVWALIGALAQSLEPLPVELLAPNTVAAQFGGNRCGREEKKARAVAWARLAFKLGIGESDHDVAEAVAVAVAGGEKWRERERLARAEADQPRLKLGKVGKR